jgi:hypothetical protein
VLAAPFREHAARCPRPAFVAIARASALAAIGRNHDCAMFASSSHRAKPPRELHDLRDGLE